MKNISPRIINSKLNLKDHGEEKSLNDYLVPNPLDIFPSKRDTISSIIITTKVNKKNRTAIKNQWLDPEMITPLFGIEELSRSSAIQKSFRRLESSQLFCSYPAINNKLLTSITNNQNISNVYSNGISKKSYILVEENKLQELLNLEKMLREERKKLNYQCSQLIQQEKLSARIPVPAMRIAVYNISEKEMRKVSLEITNLSNLWNGYCIKKHYDNPKKLIQRKLLKLHTSSTMISPQQVLLNKLTKEEIKNELQAMEFDFMSFEDDLSYLSNKYYHAQEIRYDYDKYYLLASHYGPFSENEFFLDSSPGKRYVKKVFWAIKSIIIFWRYYWPKLKIYRIKYINKITKTYRKYKIYKKYKHIIKFRWNIGRVRKYKYYYNLWKDYNAIIIKIRNVIKLKAGSWVPICFIELKKYVLKLNHRRNLAINQMHSKLNYKLFKSFYNHWNQFIKNIKHLKTFNIRSTIVPCYLSWVEFKLHSKYMKLRHKMANKIQKQYRGFLVRQKIKLYKKSIIIIENFALLVFAKKTVNKLRQTTIAKEFENWHPEEAQRQLRYANDKEKRRIVKRQKYLQEQELLAIDLLNKHLITKNGKFQLFELAINHLQIVAAKNSNNNKNKSDFKKSEINIATEIMKKQLLQKCSEFCHYLHAHDFDAKNPIAYYCANTITCKAVFATDSQYHNHILHATQHTENPLFSSFHIMLLTYRGQECIRTFILQNEGISTLANTLDLFVLIQEWKQVLHGSKSYLSKALFLYDSFLRSDCNRPVSFTYENKEEINTIVERIKKREYEGFYKLEKCTPNKWRNLLQLDGQTYEAWTTDNIIPGNIFDFLEYQSFLYLFQTLLERHFFESKEMSNYKITSDAILAQKDEVLFSNFLEYRQKEIFKWVEEYMIFDNKVGDLADIVIEVFIHPLVDLQLEALVKIGVREKVFEIRYLEQLQKEYSSLLCEELLFYLQTNTINDLVDYCINTIINIEVVEQRELFLIEVEGKNNANTLRNFSNDYFDQDNISKQLSSISRDNNDSNYYNFLAESLLPLDPDIAAIRIQKRVRGIQGRKLARKIFVRVYIKRYDPTYSAYYYENLRTGDTSWDRPYIAIYLIPNSNW